MNYQISGDPPEQTSMNYSALLREGIASAQVISGAVWTDYNEHDPGVTILEQLCYALTDLGYRTDYDVVDLLTRDAGTPPDTLYTGDRILPSGPVTKTDYQKILYDQVKGLKNVWLEPVSGDPSTTVQGLYRVRVDVYEDYRVPVEPTGGGDPQSHVGRVLADVRRILSASRTLTEDVDRVELIPTFKIRVEGTLLIDAEPSPETILANALFALSNYLVPPPSITSVDSQLGTTTPDAVFVGPLLQHGTIDDDSLRPLRRATPVAEVERMLEQIPGVRAVEAFRIVAEDPVTGETRSRSTGTLPLDGRLPILAPDPVRLPPGYDDLTLKRTFQSGASNSARDTVVDVDVVRVRRKVNRLNRQLADQDVLARQATRRVDYRTPPTGTDRNVGHYHSIQNHFPLTYGVGPMGVPNDPGLSTASGMASGDDPQNGLTARKGRAKQLKAYLLFFEQHLANHLAQLEHLPDLFGLDETLDRTYFTQPLTDVPDVDPLLASDSAEDDSNDDSYEDVLPDLVTDEDTFLDRRNRVLDHLLARFHEAFPEDELDRCDITPTGEKDVFYERLIRAKIDYLKNVVSLGSRRGRGYDPEPFSVAISYHDEDVEINLYAPISGSEAQFETREELFALRNDRLNQLFWLPVEALDSGFSDSRSPASSVETRILRNGVVAVTLRSVRGQTLAFGWVVQTKGPDNIPDVPDANDPAFDRIGRQLFQSASRTDSAAKVARDTIMELLRRLQVDDDLRAACVDLSPEDAWPQTSGLERRVRRLLLLAPTPTWPLVAREEIAELTGVFEGLSLADLLALGVDRANYAVDPASSVATDAKTSGAKTSGAGTSGAASTPRTGYVVSLSSKALRGTDQRHGKLFLPTPQAVTDRIDTLVGSFRDLTARMEDFYLVEHVLLRPHAPFATSPRTFPTADAARRQIQAIVDQLEDASEEVVLHKRYVPSYAGTPFELFLEAPDHDEVDTYYTPDDPDIDDRSTRRPLPGASDVDAYRVYVVDEPERMCLRSFHLRSEDEESRWIQALLDYGRDPDQYVVDYNVDGTTSFDLFAPPTLREIDTAFYSFRVTVVFPAWPVRFQQPDFRELAHRLVRENVPAHVCVDVFWLDPEPMIQFENHYLAWLYARADPSTDPSDLDHHAALLRRTIQSLHEDA